MWRKVIQMIVKLIFYLMIAAAVALVVPRLIAVVYSSSRITSAEKVQPVRVAIVLGAGLQRDGSPSPVLRDRVATAVELYFAGKVEKLLMSGDNRFVYYNEPGSMKEYAASLGVPEEDIVLDYAGRRTYDTCYRARHIFQLDEAILVTQKFHLPRTVLICNTLGLTSTGVPADRRNYRGSLIWTIREVPATTVALWEVLVSHPLPVLGDPEPIFPQDMTGAPVHSSNGF